MTTCVVMEPLHVIHTPRAKTVTELTPVLACLVITETEKLVLHRTIVLPLELCMVCVPPMEHVLLFSLVSAVLATLVSLETE
jgi:hypothetical protein